MFAYSRGVPAPPLDVAALPGEVTLDVTLEAAPPELVPLPADLHPALARALTERGLEGLYSHQAQAWRGVVGGQVANVLRRLRRVCEFYGSSPRFLCASATIANPVELAQKLLEADDFELVDRSGAPRGERRLIFYNPQLIDRSLGV